MTTTNSLEMYRKLWVRETLRQSLFCISLAQVCDPPGELWPQPETVEIGGLEWGVVKNDSIPEDVVVMCCGTESFMIYNIGRDDG